MRKKIKVFILGFVIVSGILGCIGTHFIAPYAIIKPYKKHLEVTPSKYNVRFNEVTVSTADSFTLKGYHTFAKTNDTKGVMILVHGVGGCKEHFLALSAQLADIGISSYLFDGRAHGESSGDYCTYGYHEKNDIRQIVDLIKLEYPNLPVGIWGNSLGGAIAIQTLAIEPRLEFGIIESTFTDLHTITYDYKKRILKGIGIKALTDYALNRAAQIANFNPDEVRPIDAVRHIEQPMFIAHGTADKHIKVEYGKALFEGLKSKNKIWYPIKGGLHTNLSKVGGDEYHDTLFDFILKNVED